MSPMLLSPSSFFPEEDFIAQQKTQGSKVKISCRIANILMIIA
jgi:hypothetical protein